MSAVLMFVLQGRLNTAPFFESRIFPLQSRSASNPFASHTWKSVPGISQIGLSTIAVQDPDSGPPGLLAEQGGNWPWFLVLYRGTKMVCPSPPVIGGFLAFS